MCMCSKFQQTKQQHLFLESIFHVGIAHGWNNFFLNIGSIVCTAGAANIEKSTFAVQLDIGYDSACTLL